MAASFLISIIYIALCVFVFFYIEQHKEFKIPKGVLWAMVALATTFTAIDLKKYNVFSMICYIGMGWAIIPFWKQVIQVMGPGGFGLLLAGGIAYTIGSILYGLGRTVKWMHSVFHLFVILGSLLQFFAVLFYAL